MLAQTDPSGMDVLTLHVAAGMAGVAVAIAFAAVILLCLVLIPEKHK